MGEANGCCPCHVHDELCWLWNYYYERCSAPSHHNYGCRSCHDDVPTVHSASTCPDYGSSAVHATSVCPDFCSPADDASAGTSPDYGSPAIHSTSTSICTNQHDERCFFRNQHDQRRFFRNSDSACLVTQDRDNASCKVPR